MNPFEEKPSKSVLDLVPNWRGLSVKPYSKLACDPFTKERIILMNGIEVEAAIFGHNFTRHCTDDALKRDLALCRRMEQMQQKRVNWMSPSDEKTIETTIGYEQLAVDLTACLAMREPDPYVKAAMDFALLEDFDHLYRYSNLLDFDGDVPAHKLTLDMVEITPGRPTIAEHRDPTDAVLRPGKGERMDIQTILGAMTLTAGEQQTMNFYMNTGNTLPEGYGRDLYQEIAMVEEEHVTQYESLLDPTLSWLEMLLLHEYQECYLYHSFFETETDRYVKKLWGEHLEMEILHLHTAAELLEKHEGKHYTDLVGTGEFPELLELKPTTEYVRAVLAEQVNLTIDRDEFVDVGSLNDEHRFFTWNNHVNGRVQDVPSHAVIREHINRFDEDYRREIEPNPIAGLQDRTSDNTQVARSKA
ncbi:MAG: hypothetical protein IJ087_00715 [Eggerthellaceae bacterium]|nr:hypothetical protein [Eggerthellaceae bacterium]